MLQRIEKRIAENAQYGALMLRLILGLVFVAHGYLAAFIYTPAGMTAFFGSLGIPFPALNAWALIGIHFAGGTMIALGLFTRINALVHGLVMLVAATTAHGAQGFFLNAVIVDAANNTAVVGGFEYALVLTVASLSLAFTGPGGLALDNFIASASPAGRSTSPAHS